MPAVFVNGGDARGVQVGDCGVHDLLGARLELRPANKIPLQIVPSAAHANRCVLEAAQHLARAGVPVEVEVIVGDVDRDDPVGGGDWGGGRAQDREGDDDGSKDWG
jgi:hypothetical protein